MAVMMAAGLAGTYEYHNNVMQVQAAEQKDKDTQELKETAENVLADHATDSEDTGFSKEESVYVKADASGNVKKTTVSEWLKNPEKGTISDTSELKDIKNVKGDETFETGSNNNVSWKSEGNSVVFGVGPCPSPVVFIGEGPGQQEDRRGEPFVGPAGQLLDDMLSIIDLGRHNCYICNIVKCRPPGNRDPQPQEQDACFGWLERQLRLLQPSIIVCLGRIAAMRLIRPDFRITREHGQWFERNGVRCLAMYHPSALLRDPARRPETYTDLLTLREAVRTLGPLPNA